MLLSLAACVSYEPAQLVPAITLSPEQVQLAPAGDGNARLDFGIDVSVNESDSLFNVTTLPGVVVRNVADGGAADTAGIEVGDVILEIDGMSVNQPDTIRVLEQQEATTTAFAFRVRRGTTVFEATVNPRRLTDSAAPRELFRQDPIASRANYRSRLLNIDGAGNLAAAEVVSLLPQSPLTAAGINVGDLILSVGGEDLSSAQDLVTRLNRDYELGQRVNVGVYDGSEVRQLELQLWDPGRRLSRLALGPLLRYQSSLSPPGVEFSLVDLWLFSLYRYRQVEGERSHSILGLINFTSDYGELIEEQ